jgi:hypothetical protein
MWVLLLVVIIIMVDDQFMVGLVDWWIGLLNGY